MFGELIFPPTSVLVFLRASCMMSYGHGNKWVCYSVCSPLWVSVPLTRGKKLKLWEKLTCLRTDCFSTFTGLLSAPLVVFPQVLTFGLSLFLHITHDTGTKDTFSKRFIKQGLHFVDNIKKLNVQRKQTHTDDPSLKLLQDSGPCRVCGLYFSTTSMSSPLILQGVKSKISSLVCSASSCSSQQAEAVTNNLGCTLFYQHVIIGLTLNWQTHEFQRPQSPPDDTNLQ